MDQDFAIQTDRKINSNRLNIVIQDYKRKTYLLIDNSLPADIISVKEYNKINYYKDQEIET